MAHSPAVARAYLGFAQALAGGRLPRRLREQITLVVGEANTCAYCVAAHTALGRRAGLTEEETKEARRAASHAEKEEAALIFAARSTRTGASWPMRTWNGSAAPATLTARSARSWPKWR
jgi:AhpD family alkylhydroperoxidase